MPKMEEHTELVANGVQLTIQQKEIESHILSIRGQQVMLDRDLAMMYGVETKRLNEAVKRNIERFPEDFMFQLNKEEALRFQNGTSIFLRESDNNGQTDSSRSQFATLNKGRGSNLKYFPYAFTEQGIAMLSSVLRSPTAVEVNIRIMRAFVAVRRFLVSNAQLFQRLETIEYHQLEMKQHQDTTDKQIEEVFRRLDAKEATPTQGIFFDGQIFDAHTFVCDLIREAKSRVILIDNYVDDSVLKRLDKRADGVTATIYTRAVSSQFQTDLDLHNGQYATIKVITTPRVHDRFLIIDDQLYHVGASIKDLGKKIFAFSLMEELPDELLSRLA